MSEQAKTHEFEGVRFQAVPVGPSETHTPLQIVCFFDQSKNQIYAGGTEAVDSHYKGAIRELRAENHFHGSLLETLLLTPSHNEIPAKKLLLIGYGNPNDFSTAHLRAVGRVAMNEAIKLGVESFCFAPSIKDAGVSSIPAGDVSLELVGGMLEALKSARHLAKKGLIPPIQLKETILLAGLLHIENSQAGLKQAIEKSS